MNSQKLITAILSSWGTDCILNIALTGNAGVGKSSFINAMRNLSSEDDEGWAKVDVIECTSRPEPYRHPQNPAVIFWDLPGVGTPRFPREKYLNSVQFEKYDFFIIFSASRFTENDLWIAKQVKDTMRHFYFVRTKIDLNIKDDRRARPRTHTESKVLDEVRIQSQCEFTTAGVQPENIYLVSNFDVDKWDYPQLKADIADILPSIAMNKGMRKHMKRLEEELKRAEEEANEALRRMQERRDREDESCDIL